MITTEQIKELRDQTGVSIMQCKKALEEALGDMEKAVLVLGRKSAEISSKKSDRALSAGIVKSYIHNNESLGVLVEVLCETDFVAKNDDFKVLAHDIAMQIAATSPQYVKKEDIIQSDIKKISSSFKDEVEKSDKPKDIKQKMLEGKLDAYFKERTLLDQPFIKNPDITIKQLINNAIQKFGEKIEVGRFARYSILNK